MVRLREYVAPLLLSIFLGTAIVRCASDNGMFDSRRTKETTDLIGRPGNSIKVVASVNEEWEDDVPYAPMLNGYNPRVVRRITFEDGSETTLDYRTLAWQPMKGWVRGEEFDPQPDEKYEVTSSNTIVREVE